MSTEVVWTQAFTIEDLEEMPDDGRRRELVDGMLIVTPAPGLVHQGCLLSLAVLLKPALSVDQKVLIAPFDWVAGPRTVFQPDLLVARRADVGPHRLERPPLLVVEVLSPCTRRFDLELKRSAYAEAGVGWYWLVDPAGPGPPCLTVLALDGGTYVEEASVTGDEPYEAAEPCRVTVVPSALPD
ncbi:MAG: Uma2 family endonuclease [Acidimicrobiales bacterium]